MDLSRVEVLAITKRQLSNIQIFEIWSNRKLAFIVVPGDKILVVNGRYHVGFELSISVYHTPFRCNTYAYTLRELYDGV